MCGIAGLVGNVLPAGQSTTLAGGDVAIAWRTEVRTARASGRTTMARVVLGHRRLAIVDLSPGGAQPMVSADGRWVISFNGELYRYRDLRRELEGRGVRLRTESDTEVLLELVARDGVVKALERINAMYGLALWDRQRRELWLARDPVGEKPLYVAEAPGGVAFASELPALRCVPDFDATIDHQALGSYLELGLRPRSADHLRRGDEAVPGGVAAVRRRWATPGERHRRVLAGR